MSMAVLKEAMAEGWQSLSFRNVLEVVGVTPLGIMIMYLCMSLLAMLSAALAMRGCSEQDPNQRELLYRQTLSKVSVSARVKETYCRAKETYCRAKET